MKKIIKKISVVLISILTIFVIAGFVIASLFSEKIEQAVIESIRSQINSNIEIGNVTFKIFDDFPYSAVQISNLYIQEVNTFGGDTLIYTKLAYIQFSPFKILSEKFEINNITLYGSKISIKYDLNENANYTVFDKKGDGGIGLENIKLIDSQIKYSALQSKSKIFLECEDVEINISKSINTNIKVNGEALSHELIIYDKNYISNKKLRFNLKIKNKKDRISLSKSLLQINDLKFVLSGSLDRKNYLDLVLDGENQNIHSLIKDTPKHLKHIYSSFLADGIIDYKGSIKGIINKDQSPHLDINYSIKNGIFDIKKYPFYLSEISCSGKISNGLENNFKTSKISLENFYAKTKKGNISGAFIINNLNNYFLDANFKSSWDMQEANYYFLESPFYECNGIINANTIYKGNISFDNKFNKQFIDAEHYSLVNLSNIEFLYKNYPLKIKIENANCKIKNNKIQVESSSVNIKDSDLSFNGEIKNLFNYIFLDDNVRFDIEGDLKSKIMNLKNLTEIQDKDQANNEGNKLPNYFTLKLNTEIQSLSFNNIYPNNISGGLNYRNKALTATNVNLNIFNGKMIVNGKFYETGTKEFKLTSTIKLEKVNIKKVFSSFNNFGQDFIQAKHLKGVCSSNIICNSFWDSNLNFNKKKLDISSKLSVKQGELINFKPLESLSNFVKIKDLSHIKFSKLENEIKIKEEVISIPNMEIKSNAVSLLISGEHKFNQEYNYKISLLLSELLAKRFRSKSTNFNTSDTLSPVKTNLQLKMTGNKDDMNISFEKTKIKENIKNEIRKEVINIKKIISEEMQNKDIVEETDDIEIEWDDNL